MINLTPSWCRCKKLTSKFSTYFQIIFKSGAARGGRLLFRECERTELRKRIPCTKKINPSNHSCIMAENLTKYLTFSTRGLSLGFSGTGLGSSLTGIFFFSFLSGLGFCSNFRLAIRAALFTKLLAMSSSLREQEQIHNQSSSVMDYTASTKIDWG